MSAEVKVVVKVLVVVVMEMVVLVVVVVVILIVVVVVVDKSMATTTTFYTPPPTTTNIKYITKHKFFLIITGTIKIAITPNTIQGKTVNTINHQNHHYNPANT